MGFQFNFAFTDSDIITSEPEISIRESEVAYIPASIVDISILPPIYEVIAEPVEIQNESENDASIRLLKRNITDVMFDVAQKDELDVDEKDDVLLKAVNSKSDLIPGVYEGGMKTWECTYDLICYHSSILKSYPERFQGKKILEVRDFLLMSDR